MKEIEVKAKVNDLVKIKDRLVNLGCVFSEPLFQSDVIYLHESLQFKKVKKGDVVLRIRNSNGKHIITLKKQLENELDNIEREIEVSDPAQAHDILTYMDYHPVVRVNKKRLKCTYQDMEICLDEVEGLGSFIEVGKMTEEADSNQVQQLLFQFLETLGVEKQDQVSKGYDTLLEEQGLGLEA